jgi:hypothetical protein
MKRRTKIDDIAQVGAELGDDQMRLAAGGMRCVFIPVYTFYPGWGYELDGYLTNDDVIYT